jgi:predicted DNA-binding ribbon-helix-helix protein
MPSLKRSITVNGHRTSVTLEAPFWESLKEIAAERGTTPHALIAKLDEKNPKNLSSAVRLFVLGYYKGS